MPEGDTIFRAASTLRKWLVGQQVTEVSTKVTGLAVNRLLGTDIEAVEPKAKHLLIRFSNGLTLHTHMRMTGSWHVYRQGEKWQKPAWQAKVMIRCGERIAVCFNAPVVELLMPTEERTHRSLIELGPDVLAAEFDEQEVIRRARTRPPEYPVGVLLLDQKVVSGIGNIYRAESLFMARINPWRPTSEVDDADLGRVLEIAVRLMKANSGEAGNRGRDFEGGGPNKPWVYKRNGQGCRVCGAEIVSARIGEQARSVYWCPNCQPRANDKKELHFSSP